jgi:hypothetical protein
MSPVDRTEALLERVKAYCSSWLSRSLQADTPFDEALRDTVKDCPESAFEQSTGPIVFPLAFHQQPHLTAGLFLQLVDAAAEAERRGTHVRLVPLGVGRASEPGPEVEADGARIAGLFAAAGWPVEMDSGAERTAAFECAVVRRARGLSFTRRAVDLPDLLASAAADAAGTDLVYLSNGMLAGRQLSRLRTLAPLGRRYVPGDPFAPVPPYAKRVPAGSDPVWATALTLGLTDAIGVDDDVRSELADLLRARLSKLWRSVESSQLARHHGIATEEPRRILLNGPRRNRASIPLFGALRLSPETRSLVAACGGLFPFELVVDDLTPRVLYPHYPVTNVKGTFHRLAGDYGGTAVFLSDLDPDDFDDRFENRLRQLTFNDLVKASPTGKSERTRGSYSGYDAVHLAVMGVAVSLRPDAVIAVQAHNVAAVHVLHEGQDEPAILSRTGPAGRLDDHELRLASHWLTQPLGAES